MLRKEAPRAPDDPGPDRILRAAVGCDFPVNILCWDNLDAGAAVIDRHPGALEATAGEVIDSTGGRSRQVDVVIYDAATTPRFLSRGGIEVLPVEPVVSVIEIKTWLNKTEIENAFENMRAVKSLQKLAYHQPSPTKKSLYGVTSERWPLQFFILAYESDGLDAVLSHVDRLNKDQSPTQQIDCVCTLDKDLIVHAGPDGLQPIPMPNTRMIAKTSSKALLTFYVLVAHLFGQAVSEPMAMHPYLAHIQH